MEADSRIAGRVAPERKWMVPRAIVCRLGVYERRGILNGSSACTQRLEKRSSERLSCTPVTGSPSNFAETSERA